jgi:hypothetical protein
VCTAESELLAAVADRVDLDTKQLHADLRTSPLDQERAHAVVAQLSGHAGQIEAIERSRGCSQVSASPAAGGAVFDVYQMLALRLAYARAQGALGHPDRAVDVALDTWDAATGIGGQGLVGHAVYVAVARIALDGIEEAWPDLDPQTRVAARRDLGLIAQREPSPILALHNDPHVLAFSAEEAPWHQRASLALGLPWVQAYTAELTGVLQPHEDLRAARAAMLEHERSWLASTPMTHGMDVVLQDILNERVALQGRIEALLR